MIRDEIKGKAWKFGSNVSTDSIAPGRLISLRANPKEYAKHVLEDARPEFAREVKEPPPPASRSGTCGGGWWRGALDKTNTTRILPWSSGFRTRRSRLSARADCSTILRNTIPWISDGAEGENV